MDARFADPVPVVWTADHGVHIEYPLGSRLLPRTGANAIRISPRVSWSIDVHGGADHLTADTTGVDVRSLAVHAAAAHTRLTLGHPAGSCTIRLTSVTDLHIRRPAHVPVRIEVAKGATKVALDDRRFGAVGGGLAEQTPGYATTNARYLLVVSGGADALTVERVE
ncbi:MAG: hypothetical protein GEV03_24720 [Streptosporangiales bacterium]|nr:hypothetical protein [Streptosporangiales bacterium]